MSPARYWAFLHSLKYFVRSLRLAKRALRFSF
jgi:hypothetical protein